MFNSIQHFQQKGIEKIIKVFENYQKDFSRMAEMVYGITEEVTKLGCSMITEEADAFEARGATNVTQETLQKSMPKVRESKAR